MDYYAVGHTSFSITMRLYNGPAVLTSHRDPRSLVANLKDKAAGKHRLSPWLPGHRGLAPNCGLCVTLEKSILSRLILVTYQLEIMTAYGFILRMKSTTDGKTSHPMPDT